MQGGVNYDGRTLLSGGINVNTTGNIQALNVQVTENGERTITPPEGVDGYAPITIDTNVPIPEPVLDTLNVTSNGTYTPPSGVDGYDEITVNVSQDVDIQPLTRTITTNGTAVINASDLNVDGFDPVTITTAVDGYTIKTLANTPTPIASFTDGTDNPLKSLTASIVPVQAGSGDPSPTNVRPITGWTEEVVTRTGKNFLPLTVKNLKANNIDGTWNGNTYMLNSVAFTVNTNESGEVTGIKASGIATNNTYFILDNNFDSTKYTGWIINGLPSNGGSGSFLFRVASQDSWSSLADYQTGTGNVLIDSGSGKRLGLRISNGYQANDVMFYPMIRQSSESAEFEPFGTTTTIPFTDSQGQSVEVFGGMLDVTSGVLTVDRVKKTLNGTEDWELDRAGAANNCFSIPLPNAKKVVSSTGETVMEIMSEHFITPTIVPTADDRGNKAFVCTFNDFYPNSFLNIGKSSQIGNTVADFKSWLESNNETIVYELATPITYQLTPTSIKSLDGENNVFASTGDVEELKYFADL